MSGSGPVMLIVGAAEGSLGDAILRMANQYDFAAVTTAGINDEEIKLDVTLSARIGEVLQQVQPDVVVCTVGVNTPCAVDDPYLPTKMSDSLMVNVVGPMELLRHFVNSSVRPEREQYTKKFVAISSNSARIPRTKSLPYCASKAALSQALRVAARELAPAGEVMVWGYEPGLLAGTPMTRETETKLGSGGPYENGVYAPVAMHRMKGVDGSGLPVDDLALRVVNDVATFSVAHNGLIFPFDAGEL